MNVVAPLILLVLLLVLLPVCVVGLWRWLRPLEVDPSSLREVLAAHRKAVGWRWAGLGLGVVAAFLTANVDLLGLFNSLGRGVMLVPTVVGLCVIGGAVVGELATTSRREGVRTAALETRSVGEYLPRWLGGLVLTSTVGLGALLVTTTLMGTADDMGRAGRTLSRTCAPGEGSGSGPWPGLFYSVPLGIAVAIGILAAAVALRIVVLRPRSGSAPGLVAADDILRRRSAEAVVAATGVMVAGSLFGIALTAGPRLIGFACPPTSWTVLGSVLLAVGVLMLFLATWCLALLLCGPRIRSTQSGETAVASQTVGR